MNKQIDVKVVVPVGTENEFEAVLKGWLGQKRAELKDFRVSDEPIEEIPGEPVPEKPEPKEEPATKDPNQGSGAKLRDVA